MPENKENTMVDLLVRNGFLSYEDYLNYARDNSSHGIDLLYAMASDKLLDEQAVAVTLAGMFGLEYINLEDYRSDLKNWGIPVEMMYKNEFIPMARDDDTITIAVSDPRGMIFLDDITSFTNKSIIYKVGSSREILNALKRSEGSAQVLRNIGEDFRSDLLEMEDDDVISMESLYKDESPVIKLVNSIILNAIQKRASDIHIESTGSGVVIKYRIDGVLCSAMDSIDSAYHAPLISRIKVMSELDIAERMTPQDGRFKLRTDGRKIDFRVSILPSIYGEDVVIRILDKEGLAEGYDKLSLDSLGFEPKDLKKFRKAIKEPYGMILVTGPTGSGKTTSLYAAISEINTLSDKIITIEDPVEYHLSGVVQIPVNDKKGLTFARGLRSILRHDPDKIMVGEIRDEETASIAIQSALTGHLVFTTVHANNAFDVIGRFTNMGIEPYNFVSSLNCILAQRLVRKICTMCKRPSNIDPQLLEESNLGVFNKVDTVFYEGIGCADCNGTGFRGREAITEFLNLSDNIKEMILDRKPPSEIRKYAIEEEGLVTMRESAVKKFMEGITTLSEINRVTFLD